MYHTILFVFSALLIIQETSQAVQPDQALINQSEQSRDNFLYDSNDLQEKSSNSRKPKFFVQITTTDNPICPTGTFEYPEGACYRLLDCLFQGGTMSGICSYGLGTCCIIKRATSTRAMLSYFESTSGRTSYTVRKNSNNICQLRLDFLQMALKQPDDQGMCTEKFTTTKNTPVICGNADGQHTPENCLQWYDKSSGTVSSFNYRDASTTQRQISNHHYVVCFKSSGSCTLVLTKAGGFVLTYNTGLVKPVYDTCTTDYIYAPNAQYEPAKPVSNICGDGDPDYPIKINSPFLYFGVVTDNKEDITDAIDYGFSFDYDVQC